MGDPVIKNILVYVESSEASLYATEYAIILSKICKCHLTALYVVDMKLLDELFKMHIFVKVSE